MTQADSRGRRELLPTVLRMPLRRQRADMLTAHIMHVLRPFIDPSRERDALRDAYRALNELLHESGAEIISDADRQYAGLARRDEHGMTAEHLAMLEARFTQAMLNPVAPMIFPGDKP